MQVRAVVCLSFFAVATFLAAQQPIQTENNGAANNLTYSADGIAFTGSDGTRKQIPASWLNENCPDLSKAGITDPKDVAAFKEICGDWAKFNEQAAQTQTEAQPQESVSDPPASIPDNCSVMDVLAVSQHGHSDAYDLLGYQIAALSIGHQAEATGAVVLKSMKSPSATDPAAMLADIFQNLDLATDEYRCGAYLVGQYQATGEDRQTDRATTISVYNRLAVVNASMKAYIERRFRNMDSQSATDVVDNANTLAKLTNDRKAAFSDLVTAMAYSGLLSIYAGDPTAKVADTLNMSAAERQQLLTQVNQMLKTGPPDGFTQAADLLKTFLDKHPKVLN